ncbi:MAG: HEPN/Toprim-associated domain-containing protein [Thermodesulfobacteriota bacterium]|nr:HEPN/Toprim-associated domain-containing protein [Thermodesulfobacteriota bacterium]
MGSLISLGIGHLEIDWGKNSFFNNHSKLFLPVDRKPATYYYADNIREQKPALVRPLASVKERLEFLGYTLEYCRDSFYDLLAYHSENLDDPFSDFDTFSKVLLHVDVDKQKLPDEPDYYDLGEYVTKNILQDSEFIKTLPSLDKLNRFQGTFYENIDPYIVLRLLAENAANLDKHVIWRYSDVLDGGWTNQDELFAGLHNSDKYLVVTEGGSDSKILMQSLEPLYPHVADFFNFIDMSENYPFTGTGNVYRFCQGLASIKIQNKILVVLDNDTSGNEIIDKIRSVDLPSSMYVTTLPNLPDFESFSTIGPSGASREDINGKAVSIELFLDHHYDATDTPTIRWSSYNQTMDQYQGELVNTGHYTRLFLNHGWRDGAYDYSKLGILWKHLLDVCKGGI